MQDPKALGMVLATIVDQAGKPVRGSAAKGQLYVSGDEITVVRPTPAAEFFERASLVLLVGSVLVAFVNIAVWNRAEILWAAVAAQALYWVTLPRRRRALEPQPLGAAALEAVRKAGRVAIQVPAKAVLQAVPPEPPKRGFRKPARFVLPDGALEIYLSEEQFQEAAAALRR